MPNREALAIPRGKPEAAYNSFSEINSAYLYSYVELPSEGVRRRELLESKNKAGARELRLHLCAYRDALFN